MTEIVSGIIEWACAQSGVKPLLSSTGKTNTASFKVLE
jgi:hypothetical protein